MSHVLDTLDIADRGKARVDLVYSPDPLNPYVGYDNVGTIYTRNARWGEATPLPEPHELAEMYPDAATPKAALVTWAQEHHGATVVLPIYAYEHGQVALTAGAFADPWHSLATGVIFDIAAGRELVAGDRSTPEQIESALKGELDDYARFVAGAVYRLRIYDEDGDELTWTHRRYQVAIGEAAGDILGMDQAEAAMREVAASLTAYLDGESTEAAHWAACDVATVGA